MRVNIVTSLSHYHVCFFQVMWKQVLSVGPNTTENATAYISPSPSRCTTLVHHPPMPSCVSIFSRADSPHSCWLTTRVVWDFDLLFFSVMPFSVHTSAFCSLLKLSRSVVDHICPTIDLFNLSAPLDTGVPTSPEAEVPHSPVSSSAPPTQRNITLSQRVLQRPSRPFSTSKTFTHSSISSTTKGNGVADFCFVLPEQLLQIEVLQP